MSRAVRRQVRRFAAALGRLHRDERGDLFEALLIIVVFVIPVSALVLPVLFQMLRDYYMSFAYCVGWPFL